MTLRRISVIIASFAWFGAGLFARNPLASSRLAAAQLPPVSIVEGTSIYVGGVDFNPRALAVDGDGNMYVSGDEVTQNSDGSSDTNIGLYKVSPQFQQLFGVSIGGADYDSVRAMAIDGSGNVYLTGGTRSPDFPIAKPIQGALNGLGDLFLTKLDPQGNILASTYYGGAGNEIGEVLAVDSDGNTYVGGRTGSSDFPVTPGAFLSEVVTPAGSGEVTTKFVLKVSASEQLEFATSMGGSRSGPEGFSGIAPAPGGDVYLLQIPGATSPGNGSTTPQQGLVRLSSDGASLVFATDIGRVGADTFSAMAPELDGNLVLAGSRKFLRWDVASNQELERHAEDIGRSPTVAVDWSGNAVVHGTGSGGHPITYFGFTAGNEFVTKFHGIGPQVYFGGAMPAGTADVAVAVGPFKDIYTLGSSGLLSRLVPKVESIGIPRILGVASSAGQTASSKVAPGEIVSLYGPMIGGPDATGTQVSANGEVVTDLAGIHVLFNGMPGSMLYTGPTQINVAAPFDLGSSDSVLVEVLHGGEPWAAINLHPVKAAPGVFPLDGTSAAAAALDANGTVNSPASRAEPGSVVTVYVTGAGDMKSASYQDGEVFDSRTPVSNLPTPKLPIEVSYQGTPLKVLYFGQAPGELAGVVQLNDPRLEAGGLPRARRMEFDRLRPLPPKPAYFTVGGYLVPFGNFDHLPSPEGEGFPPSPMGTLNFRLPASAPSNVDAPVMIDLNVGTASADPFGIWVAPATTR